jgi:hypothetical protein
VAERRGRPGALPGGPDPIGLEGFFERFAQLPEDASVLEAFRTIGPEAGMEVVGPPLAHPDPL